MVFYIAWGTKTVAQRLGHVADFCPICRAIAPFRLRRLKRVGHLYGIGLGSGRLAGHTRECLNCRVLFGADPELYASFARRKTALPELIAATFPQIETHYAQRLRQEAMIQADPLGLPANLRQYYVQEPFRLLAPMVEAFFGQVRLDFYVFLVPALVLTAVFYLAPLVPLPAEFRPQAAKAVLTVCGALLFIMGFGVGGRWMRRKIYPRLAEALAPLHPSEEEIGEALAALKKAGHRFGRRGKPKQVLRFIARAEAKAAQQVQPAGTGMAVVRG